MNNVGLGSTVGLPLAIASVAMGFSAFAALSILLPAPLLVPGALLLLISAGLAAVGLLATRRLSRRNANALPREATAIAALIVGGTLIVLAAAYQIAAYVALPVDLLSWPESPFVNKIIRLRLGVPLYSPPEDNESNPYPPGAEILTFLISSALGRGDSIPFFRAVQLSYVILATLIAVSITDHLARQFLSPSAYRARPLWITFWALFLFLLAIEPRFNAFVFSLHNDGLALLVSVCGYWLMVRHWYKPRGWLIAVMAVLPALGFLVKQNQLLWAGIFAFYLLIAGNVSRRQLALFAGGTAACVVAVIGASYLMWGDVFLLYVFRDPRSFPIIIPRSIMNLFLAGAYVVMGLVGGWILLLRNWSRAGVVIWISWITLFAIQAYTSGFAFLVNHLGPPVLLAGCWFLVAVAALWGFVEGAQFRWQRRVQQLIAVASVLLLLGGLGALREPRNPIPDDFFRYVAEIERQFQGEDPDKVLIDIGTWIYLRESTLMKDRSPQVGLRAGHSNQALEPERLAATIQRIEARTYNKILARELDTPNTLYDFQDHGSGVKTAMLRNYRVIERIPPVRGIERWSPEHLLAEVLVLVPNPPTVAAVPPDGGSIAASASTEPAMNDTRWRSGRSPRSPR